MQRTCCTELSMKRKRTRCSASSSHILSRELDASLNALHQILLFYETARCSASSPRIIRCGALDLRTLIRESDARLKFGMELLIH